MSNIKEDYNITNYLKRYLDSYGLDIFAPINYYKLMYDPCNIDNDDNDDNDNDDTKKNQVIMIKEFRNLLRELMLYVNDLLRIFVKLYNLEMSFVDYIKNGEINMIRNNRELFDEISLEAYSNKFNKSEEKFTPMKYKSYVLDGIYLLNEKELIVLSDFLLNKVKELKLGIMKLSKLSEKISFVKGPKEVGL